MSLFSVLNVGTRGLAASQLAMDVAGQNISNADVDGYSRKRLNLTPDYRYDSSYGQMGTGVDVVNIERMRNTFIDQQICQQNQDVGYYDQINTALDGIQNIFTEPSDTGIQTYVDQFFDSWQNLTNNPSDLSARTMVRTNGEIMTDAFHNLSNQLESMLQSQNSEIEDRVSQINEMTKEIYNLNKEIGAVEINNQNANDSRDKRDKLLKDLSKLTEISTTENAMGQITVTSGGSILVSPVNYQEIQTTKSTIVLDSGAQTTQVGLQFANSKLPYVPQNGQLKALFEIRDNVIPEYQKKLDTLATGIATEVNKLHESGYNLNGYSGNSFFDEGVTGASNIEISASVKSDVQNIAAASAGELKPGVVNTFAANAHNYGSVNQLYRDPAAVPPVNAKNIVRGSLIVTTPTATLKEGTDYQIDYTNGTIQMLHAGFDTVPINVDFQYRTGGFNGPGDNSNAVAIAKLRDNLTMTPNVIGENTSTFTEYYSSMIGNLGLNKNQASSSLETRNFLVDQYTSQQDAIAGVSLDEEMADLIKYQHTYQAAARLISITNEMLDTLIKM